MDSPRMVHGQPTNSPKAAREKPAGSYQRASGQPMDSPRIIHEHPTDSPFEESSWDFHVKKYLRTVHGHTVRGQS